MCNSPYSPRARARTFSTDSSARLNNSRTSSRKSFPSAVSVTPRGLRFIKSTPISSSRSCTCRLRAGCATRSCAAALVKFNASPTARKYRRCRSSIAAFHYAGKAGQRKERGIGQVHLGQKFSNSTRVNIFCELDQSLITDTVLALNHLLPLRLERGEGRGEVSKISADSFQRKD